MIKAYLKGAHRFYASTVPFHIRDVLPLQGGPGSDPQWIVRVAVVFPLFLCFCCVLYC